VDRVFVLLGPESAQGFSVWFERPLDADGVPSRATDGEFLLRAPEEKVQKGRPERFYAACAAKGFVKAPWPARRPSLLANEPTIRPQLVSSSASHLPSSREGSPAQAGFTRVLSGGAFVPATYPSVGRRSPA
jgi:hypothetical protein